MNSQLTDSFESIAIIGPTASGKTGRAISVSKLFNGEILSADSRQVYKDMDLGTGKDLEEYGQIKYHLIDICEAGEKYNLYKYIKDFQNAYNKVLQAGKLPVICGGTGMYVENALSGIVLPDVPENIKLREKYAGATLEELAEILKGYKRLHNSTDIDTTKRAIRAIEIEEYYRLNPAMATNADRSRVKPLNTLIIGIDIPREERRRRISERLDKRLEDGMLDEIRYLLKKGVKAEDLIYYGLEYKYLTLHIIGELSFDEMRRQLEIAIHQFAKRQMTWFRGMERRGFTIHWLPFNLSEEQFLERINELLN